MDNPTVWIDRFGDPDEVLTVVDRPRPVPGAGEMLVRVAAASVNPVDGKTAQGLYPPMGDPPFALGRDAAGTIVQVGPGVAGQWEVGARVFAFIGTDRGAQTRWLILREDELAFMPEALDWTHAAAVPLAAMTAWQGLFRHGGLTAGQRVLIHGGAGGVGHFAVQFARAAGAAVYATASAHDREFVERLGAERVIDYQAERFDDILRDLDLVFDTQSGEVQRRSFAVLKPGGLVSTTLQPNAEAAGAAGVRITPRWQAEPDGAELAAIGRMIADGVVRVTVAKTFPIEEAIEAYRFTREEHPRGKVVLTLPAD